MSNPIRVGIMGWSANQISGTGSLIRTLLKGLRNNSQVNFLVALPSSQPSTDPTFEKFPLSSVRVVGDNIQAWMEKAFEALAPHSDVIFYPDSMLLPHSTASSPRPVKSVTLLHDVLPLTLPEYYLHPLKYWKEKRKFLNIARHAHRIITISEYSRQMIMHKLKIPESKIRLIYNGVDPYFHNPHLPETTNRQGILYVGDLRRRKNVMALARAYSLLDENIQEQHPLILAADGKQKQAILRVLKPVKTPPIFRPRQNSQQLKEAYLKAKVFVFPSLQEGFGLPIIEAQQNGLPVICGDHTSLGEITRSLSPANPSAYYVNVNRPEEIAEGITDLISHPELYRDYQSRGFTNSQGFRAEKMVEAYQFFFEGLHKSQ